MKAKTTKAVRTVAIMMAATVLSKVLGMLRGVLMASHYGTTDAANAFNAAQRIPLSFFDMLFSAAIVGCFVPVYNSLAVSDDSEADGFANTFFQTILLFTGILALAGICLAQPIIALIAPEMTPEATALAVTLLRIMFPMVIFVGGTYTLVGVMQSKGSFILPAMISTISNAGIIVYFVLIDRNLGDHGIYGLAVAYLIAWLLQLLTLVVPLSRRGFSFRPRLDFKNPALHKALKMTIPVMVGSWLPPISALSGTYFAARIATDGAISIFEYTNNVYIMLAGTMTYSICNFVFPKLSRLASDEDPAAFAETVQDGVKTSLFITVPVMLAVFVLASEGISVLYLRDNFTAADAASTAQMLRMMAIAMPFYGMIELGSRVFFSRQMLRQPVIAAVTGVAVNISATALLCQTPFSGVAAIGLGNALGQIAAAAVMVTMIHRRLKGILSRNLFIAVFKTVLCGAGAFGAMQGVHLLMGNAPYTAGMLVNLLTLAVVFAVGAAVYFVLSRLLRLKITLK